MPDYTYTNTFASLKSRILGGMGVAPDVVAPAQSVTLTFADPLDETDLENLNQVMSDLGYERA